MYFISFANDPFQIFSVPGRSEVVRFVLSDLLMTSATRNPEMVFNLGEMQSGINQLLIGKHPIKWLFGSTLFFVRACMYTDSRIRIHISAYMQIHAKFCTGL